jgi:hypothetical protein
MTTDTLPPLPPLPDGKWTLTHKPNNLERLFHGKEALPAKLLSDEQVREFAREYALLAVKQESYVLELLVAAGHISPEKVEEARTIAAGIRNQP